MWGALYHEQDRSVPEHRQNTRSFRCILVLAAFLIPDHPETAQQ